MNARILIIVLDETNNASLIGKINEDGHRVIASELCRDEALGTIAGELYGKPHTWFDHITGQRPAHSYRRQWIAKACIDLRKIVPDWPMPSWYVEGDEIEGGPDEVGPPKALPANARGLR